MCNVFNGVAGMLMGRPQPSCRLLCLERSDLPNDPLCWTKGPGGAPVSGWLLLHLVAVATGQSRQVDGHRGTTALTQMRAADGTLQPEQLQVTDVMLAWIIYKASTTW